MERFSLHLRRPRTAFIWAFSILAVLQLQAKDTEPATLVENFDENVKTPSIIKSVFSIEKNLDNNHPFKPLSMREKNNLSEKIGFLKKNYHDDEIKFLPNDPVKVFYKATSAKSSLDKLHKTKILLQNCFNNAPDLGMLGIWYKHAPISLSIEKNKKGYIPAKKTFYHHISKLIIPSVLIKSQISQRYVSKKALKPVKSSMIAKNHHSGLFKEVSISSHTQIVPPNFLVPEHQQSLLVDGKIGISEKTTQQIKITTPRNLVNSDLSKNKKISVVFVGENQDKLLEASPHKEELIHEFSVRSTYEIPSIKDSFFEHHWLEINQLFSLLFVDIETPRKTFFHNAERLPVYLTNNPGRERLFCAPLHKAATLNPSYKSTPTAQNICCFQPYDSFIGKKTSVTPKYLSKSFRTIGLTAKDPKQLKTYIVSLNNGILDKKQPTYLSFERFKNNKAAVPLYSKLKSGSKFFVIISNNLALHNAVLASSLKQYISDTLHLKHISLFNLTNSSSKRAPFHDQNHLLNFKLTQPKKTIDFIAHTVQTQKTDLGSINDKLSYNFHRLKVPTQHKTISSPVFYSKNKHKNPARPVIQECSQSFNSTFAPCHEPSSYTPFELCVTPAEDIMYYTSVYAIVKPRVTEKCYIYDYETSNLCVSNNFSSINLFEKKHKPKLAYSHFGFIENTQLNNFELDKISSRITIVKNFIASSLVGSAKVPLSKSTVTKIYNDDEIKTCLESLNNLKEKNPAFSEFIDLSTLTLKNEFSANISYCESKKSPKYLFRIDLSSQLKGQFKAPEQHFIFVIDGSNSIKKERFKAFINGVKKSLVYLSPQDTFDIIISGKETLSLFRKPKLANPSNIKEVVKSLNLCSYDGYFSKTDPFTLLKKITPRLSSEKENFVLYLTDGKSFHSLEDSKNGFKELLCTQKSNLTLFTACASNDNNIPALDILSAFCGGKVLHSNTNASFARKLAIQVKNIKSQFASNIRITLVPAFPEGSCKLDVLPDSSMHQNLYLKENFTVYGTTDKLCDLKLIIQGQYGQQWVNIIENISFDEKNKCSINSLSEANRKKGYFCFKNYFMKDDPYYFKNAHIFMNQAKKMP